MRRRSKEQGAALILAAMGAVVILFAVIVAQIQIQQLTTKSSLLLRHDVQSRESARSGLELGLERLRQAKASGGLGAMMTQMASADPGTRRAGRDYYRSQFPQGQATDERSDPYEVFLGGKTMRPASYRLGNGCVGWWFGLVNPSSQTIRLHVVAASPYVYRGPSAAEPDSCEFGNIVGSGSDTTLNPQRGIVYLLTATIATGGPTLVVEDINYDKRTFNL